MAQLGTHGTDMPRHVSITMTDEDARFVLLMLRTRQDECRKCPPEFPTMIREGCQDLDIRIENVKMKIAGQI